MISNHKMPRDICPRCIKPIYEDDAAVQVQDQVHDSPLQLLAWYHPECLAASLTDAGMRLTAVTKWVRVGGLTFTGHTFTATIGEVPE